MPSQYIPRKRGVHRVAAIALYRALFAASERVPLTFRDRDRLQNVIRNTFKRNVHLTSVRLLTAAFNAGYTGLGALRRSAGLGSDGPERNSITDFLARVKEVLTLPAPGTARYPTKKNTSEAEKTAGRHSPREAGVEREHRPILERRPRPASALKGVRRVPILAAAARIPFLRLTKPQPESLSAYIRQRLRVDLKRWDRKNQLALHVHCAQREDEWEVLLARSRRDDAAASETPSGRDGAADGPEKSGVPCRRRDEPKWATEAYRAWSHVWWLIGKDNLRSSRIARKMQAIVDAEQALADREERTRLEGHVGLGSTIDTKTAMSPRGSGSIV